MNRRAFIRSIIGAAGAGVTVGVGFKPKRAEAKGDEPRGYPFDYKEPDWACNYMLDPYLDHQLDAMPIDPDMSARADRMIYIDREDFLDMLSLPPRHGKTLMQENMFRKSLGLPPRYE